MICLTSSEVWSMFALEPVEHGDTWAIYYVADLGISVFEDRRAADGPLFTAWNGSPQRRLESEQTQAYRRAEDAIIAAARLFGARLC
jgi:hypothetical protein